MTDPRDRYRNEPDPSDPTPDDPTSWVNYRDPTGKRWQLEMRWGEIDGRWELTDFRIQSVHPTRGVAGPHVNAITADLIRRMPLGTIIQQQRRRHAALGQHVLKRTGDQAAATAIEEKWGPHRGTALTRPELERVAAAYNHARNVTFTPVTQAVADACNVSLSTAGKRIMAARKAGLIAKERSQS